MIAKQPDPRPQYSLLLRVEPGDVPATVRLRRFLKLALRGFGLRCLSLQETGPKGEPRTSPVLKGGRGSGFSTRRKSKNAG
jgi:hypothetical protein